MRNDKITPLYERLSRDDEAAAVVRQIFSLTMEGFGPYQISQLLKQQKIEIPAVHLARHGEGVNKTKTFKDPCGWGSSTIVHILKKREYLGHTVNFKTRKHFKDKKSHYVNESEWTIFENTHEAIIDQETFANVQRIRANFWRYPDGYGEIHPPRRGHGKGRVLYRGQRTSAGAAERHVTGPHCRMLNAETNYYLLSISLW